MIINHIAVFVCALVGFLLGGLWYSPLLFGKAWQSSNGFSDEDLKRAKPAIIFPVAFLLSLLMSYNLAFFLSDAQTDWKWGVTAGFLTGFGWCACIFTVIALFEMRPVKYILVNGGYIVIYFTLIGLILGAWR